MNEQTYESNFSVSIDNLTKLIIPTLYYAHERISEQLMHTNIEY